MQAHEAPALALIGPGIRPRARQLREPLLVAQLGATGCARRRLLVVSACLRGGAASLRNPEHLELGGDVIRSPRRTARAGFTRSPFKWTLPPMIAAVASERVL
jgi:hypothetical protein